MRIDGTTDIGASRERVWASLIDPGQAAGCVPGIGGLEVRDATHFDLTKVGVGTVRTNVRVRIAMTDLRPPEHVRFEGSGSSRGATVQATADVDLRDGPTDGTTTLSWVIDSQVRGRLAVVGRRMLDRAAGPLIAQTLRCLDVRLREPGSVGVRPVALTQETIRAFDPEWCLFWGLSVNTAQLEIWMPYLEHSRHRFVIMTPDDIGESVRTRVAAVPNVRIIEPYLQGLEWLAGCPGFRGYLYIGTRPENFQMIERHREAAHVFIGHGESGKGGSGFRTASLYDAVFLADYGSVRRFPRSIRWWVRRGAIATGAPIVAGIHKDAWRRPRRIRTLLYAPTWEGNEGDDCTSLDVVAPVLCEVLPELTARGIALILRPHPSTGVRIPALRASVASLVEAGALTGVGKAEAFDRADVLIGDVSGVTAEFLLTEKPTIMPIVAKLARLDADPGWLDREYPWVDRWDATPDGLLALLVSIETRDPRRGQRARDARRKFRHHRSIDDAARTFDLALDTLPWRHRPIPLRLPYEAKVLRDRLRARLPSWG